MTLPVADLACMHLPFPQLAQRSAEWLQGVLGFACFDGSGGEEKNLPDIPSLAVAMPLLLEPAASVCEVWHSPVPLSSGQHGPLSYRHGNDLLFGRLSLPESRFALPLGGAMEQTPLRQATAFAYRHLFGLLESLHFPYLFRVWQYFPDINRDSHGVERYRQFNAGRQDGFVACGRELTANVPAACALGSLDGPLNVCFLAGRKRPLPIENPRQLSAYHYPRRYGPRSPIFSRASLARIGTRDVLFISGTASIVGHRSRHPGDAIAQTRETLANIEAIVEQANRHATAASFDLHSLSLKVYVRHASDAANIRDEIHRFLGAPMAAVFLQADICRHDLLVEIEATAGHRLECP